MSVLSDLYVLSVVSVLSDMSVLSVLSVLPVLWAMSALSNLSLLSVLSVPLQEIGGKKRIRLAVHDWTPGPGFFHFHNCVIQYSKLSIIARAHGTRIYAQECKPAISHPKHANCVKRTRAWNAFCHELTSILGMRRNMRAHNYAHMSRTLAVLSRMPGMHRAPLCTRVLQTSAFIRGTIILACFHVRICMRGMRTSIHACTERDHVKRAYYHVQSTCKHVYARANGMRAITYGYNHAYPRLAHFYYYLLYQWYVRRLVNCHCTLMTVRCCIVVPTRN